MHKCSYKNSYVVNSLPQFIHLFFYKAEFEFYADRKVIYVLIQSKAVNVRFLHLFFLKNIVKKFMFVWYEICLEITITV